MKFSVQHGSSAKVGAEQTSQNQRNSLRVAKASAIKSSVDKLAAAEVSISTTSAFRPERKNSIRNVEDANELAKMLTNSILASESEAIEAQGKLSPGKVLTLVDSQILQ